MANSTAVHRELVRRDECTDYGGTYTSQATAEKPSFKLYCGEDYNEENMAQVWAGTFAKCMDTCAGYNTGNIATCLGVSYDAKSTTGLSNCFLKAANNLERLVKPDHVVFRIDFELVGVDRQWVFVRDRLGWRGRFGPVTAVHQ